MSLAGQISARTVSPGNSADLPFWAFFEAVVVGIAICSPEGRILECNPALARTLGFAREELIRMNVRDFGSEDGRSGDRLQESHWIADLLASARNHVEVDQQIRRRDGTLFSAHVRASMVRANQGEQSFVIAILEDTSSRPRMEEELREAERMEIIGRLAGGVAHDFNNLLTGVLLYCDLLSTSLPSGNRLREYVDEVRMAGEQGATLTQQLLAIARKQPPQQRRVQLDEIIASTEKLIRRLVGEHIEVIILPSQANTVVFADPTQLRQILLNLVLNARDAMTQAGTTGHVGRITICADAAVFPDTEKAAVVLSVQDNGCGMDDATRARMFEPFFTTKQAGQGTGLGLATVRRIVDEARGAIQVKSDLGTGTLVEVFFPALPDLALVPIRPESIRARETILLVDDHPGARRSLHQTLVNAGYLVHPASNGKQALEVFSKHAGAIDLVVADSRMPDMDGLELVEHLRREKSGLKALLISGYRPAPDDMEMLSVPLIHKPFSETEITQQIRNILDCNGEMPC